MILGIYNARLLLDQARYDDVRSNLQEILELTDRMAQISSQLKQFARKSSGKKVRVDLHRAIEAAWAILRPQVKKSQTHLLHSDNEPICVVADTVQLEQVLVNLFANAMHAMEAIEERWIDVSTLYKNGHLIVHIHDNGPGIADENLEQIFSSYFTTRETGLGLGLSISQEIMESMGGRLYATNHVDGGAVFVLELILCTNENL
jgi:two-component system, NtrC family, C4-dicarboxylate transport sensor histidine kinase DctB